MSVAHDTSTSHDNSTPLEKLDLSTQAGKNELFDRARTEYAGQHSKEAAQVLSLIPVNEIFSYLASRVERANSFEDRPEDTIDSETPEVLAAGEADVEYVGNLHDEIQTFIRFAPDNTIDSIRYDVEARIDEDFGRNDIDDSVDDIMTGLAALAIERDRNSNSGQATLRRFDDLLNDLVTSRCYSHYTALYYGGGV